MTTSDDITDVHCHRDAMRVLPTSLDGVLVLELDAFGDACGRWNDPELAIAWPAVGDLVMSDREARWLGDAELPL